MTPVTLYAKSGDVLFAYQVTDHGADTLVLAPGNLSHLDLDWEFPLRFDEHHADVSRRRRAFTTSTKSLPSVKELQSEARAA